jgi:hypothetical protein
MNQLVYIEMKVARQVHLNELNREIDIYRRKSCIPLSEKTMLKKDDTSSGRSRFRCLQSSACRSETPFRSESRGLAVGAPQCQEDAT